MDIHPVILHRLELSGYPLLIDSGFRSGTDIAKALALGANAVLIGRPALYGLAVDGEKGVADVLQLLSKELTRTMTLLGASNVHSLQEIGLKSNN